MIRAGHFFVVIFCLSIFAFANSKTKGKLKTDGDISRDEIRAIVDSFPGDSAEEIQLIRRVSKGVYFVELLEPKGRCKAQQFHIQKTDKGLKARSLAKVFDCQSIESKEAPKNDGVN